MKPTDIKSNAYIDFGVESNQKYTKLEAGC